METGNGGYNNDSSLLSQAFHSPQDLQDRSPDVIPHFTTTGGGKFKVKFIDRKSNGIVLVPRPLD